MQLVFQQPFAIIFSSKDIAWVDRLANRVTNALVRIAYMLACNKFHDDLRTSRPRN